MTKRMILPVVAAAGFALAGCDSQAENEVEEQATAIDEAYEADAELEEAMTEGGPDEATGEAPVARANGCDRRTISSPAPSEGWKPFKIPKPWQDRRTLVSRTCCTMQRAAANSVPPSCAWLSCFEAPSRPKNP